MHCYELNYIFNFLEKPAIPSDNNASERGIRKLKVKQKKHQVVSGKILVQMPFMHCKKILKHCILLGAEGVIVCHNHPSGNMRPSGPDDSHYTPVWLSAKESRRSITPFVFAE